MLGRFAIGLAGFLLIAACAIAQAPANAQPAWRVTWEPSRLVNGSPVLFRVKPPSRLQALHANWFDRRISFRFDTTCDCWYAIAGVDLNARPGKYPLRFQPGIQETDGPAFVLNVTVAAKRYPTSTISVPPAYVAPPPEVQSRIEEEEALKKRLFAEINPETLWAGNFAAPVATATTGQFGSARTYNGVTKSQHRGLDYHAAVGTTVRATNRGKVILARGLYFEGNCVALDHGDGLITLYMHFSEIKVHEGDTVARGEVLGLSGGTGRVTGPHLHFAVRWQGIYVDPATLLAMHIR